MSTSSREIPTLELRPTLGDEPRWVVVAAIFVGLALGNVALYAIFELFPELGRLLYPMSFALMAAVFTPFMGLLMAFYLFHRIVLSPQGVEIRWGLYRKSLRAAEIEVTFYLEERNYRALGAMGRPKTIMFGTSFTGHDFERARDWLRAFAEIQGIELRPLQSRQQFFALMREHM